MAAAALTAAAGTSVRGGPVVAVCGLHGGAGTTSVAVLLARAAAARAPAGAILLADSDPAGGGLALHLRTASPHGLADLAAAHAAQRALAAPPFVQLYDGLRLCAPAPVDRGPLPPDAVGPVLADARAAHLLTVIDAGQLREPHAQAVLEHADVVIWALSSDADLHVARQLLSSPLARVARGARWLLVVSDGGRRGAAAPVGDLARSAPTAVATVLVPFLRDLPDDDDRRRLAAASLLAALST